MLRAVYIGFDPRETAAFAVARNSVRRLLPKSIPIYGLVLSELINKGLYSRPMFRRPSGVMWDVISDAPMSTEHANARFLVPHLQRSASRACFKPLNEKTPRYAEAPAGWVVFMDCDMLVRVNLDKATDGIDASKAVYCVQHNYVPHETAKMDGQIQTKYSRKNWSSFMVVNCDHPSNQALTVEMVNTLPGRELHQFCWLEDDEIGELDPSWNFLVGHTDPAVIPKVIHFTEGLPDMDGYADVPFADEWRSELMAWAA